MSNCVPGRGDQQVALNATGVRVRINSDAGVGPTGRYRRAAVAADSAQG